MSFRLASIPTLAACRKHCDRVVNTDVVVATGEINNGTGDEFLSFISEHAAQARRPVVLIHSPGGTVVGSMQLGLAFRRAGAAVIVAQAFEDEQGGGHVVRGSCMSACVYAFFGGVKRIVPGDSRLGIHRMAIYGSERDPAGGTASTRTFGTNDIVTALSNYTKLMGVNPAVIAYAEQVAPETIHIVTPQEISRWRLGSRL